MLVNTPLHMFGHYALLSSGLMPPGVYINNELRPAIMSKKRGRNCRKWGGKGRNRKRDTNYIQIPAYSCPFYWPIFVQRFPSHSFRRLGGEA